MVETTTKTATKKAPSGGGGSANGASNGASAVASTSKGAGKPTNGVNGTTMVDRKPSIKSSKKKPFSRLKGESKDLYEALLEHEDQYVDPKQVWRTLDIADEDGPRIINDLSQLSLIQLATKDKAAVVKAVPMEQARKRGALEEDAKLVMDSITRGGNRGAWTRYIVRETGLTNAAVDKILKKLLKDELVKPVSSVRVRNEYRRARSHLDQNKTQRIYMLFDLEPSVELTGGPWYTDSKLDEAFVDNLLTLCDKYIRERSYPKRDISAGKKAVHQYYPVAYDAFLPHARELLTELSKLMTIHASKMTVDDVEMLLNALVADGLVERIRITRDSDDVWALDQAEEEAATAAEEKKRKRTNEAGPSTKRVRHAEPDSDHLDESGAEEEEQSEDDGDDDLPPQRDFTIMKDGLEVTKDSHREGKAGPPGRKPYVVYRSVHRVRPPRLIDDKPVPAIPTATLGHQLGLVGDSPCGSCPVRHQCDNRGHPLPKTTTSLADSMTRSLSPSAQLAGLAIRAPQSNDDHADGIWRGGGTKGRQRLGPINPRECEYFNRWVDTFDW